MKRQYTIAMDVQTYGDGITHDEMRKMAFAEADALRSLYPDAEIHVVEGVSFRSEMDDPQIHEYATSVWDRILTVDADPDAIVRAWQTERRSYGNNTAARPAGGERIRACDGSGEDCDGNPCGASCATGMREGK